MWGLRQSVVLVLICLAIGRAVYWMLNADLVHERLHGDFFHHHTDAHAHAHQVHRVLPFVQLRSAAADAEASADLAAEAHHDPGAPNAALALALTRGGGAAVHTFPAADSTTRPGVSAVPQAQSFALAAATARSPAHKSPEREAAPDYIEAPLDSVHQLVILPENVKLPRGNRSAPARHKPHSTPPSAWPKRAEFKGKGFIFQNNEEMGYGHMAAVTRLHLQAPFRWMSAWQAAKKIEGTDGQKLWVAFSNNGKDWGRAMVFDVGRSPTAAVWSPVLFTRGDYTYFFFSESTRCRKNGNARKPPRWAPGGDIRMTKSRDGITWQSPWTIYQEELDGAIPKVIANPPEVLPNGKWILPFWRERPLRQACKTSGTASAGVLVSDTGVSWDAEGHLRGKNTWLIEGTVAQLPGGQHNGNHLIQLFRTSRGLIYESTTQDNGKTWTEVESTGLPNPNSKIHLLRLTTGELALCYNASPRSRSKLRVAISPDAKHWYTIAEVEAGSGGLNYAYPTMAQDGDQLIVTYSIMRRSAKVPITHTGIRYALVQLPRPHTSTLSSGTAPHALHANASAAPAAMTFLTEDGQVDVALMEDDALAPADEKELDLEDENVSLQDDQLETEEEERIEAEAEEEAEAEGVQVLDLPTEVTTPRRAQPAAAGAAGAAGVAGAAEAAVEVEPVGPIGASAEVEEEDGEEDGEEDRDEGGEVPEDVEEIEDLDSILTAESAQGTARAQGAGNGSAVASSEGECWDHGDGVLASLRQSRSHQLIVKTTWISRNTKQMGYQHMAMMSRLPPSVAPLRFISIWQASESYEGSEDQHFECALSRDGRSWSHDCHIPLNRDDHFTLHEDISMKTGKVKSWRRAVWSPVLHLQEETGDLWLFYSQSTKCLQFTKQYGKRLRLARWGPGGDIKFIKTTDLKHWTEPQTIYEQSIDGVPKVIANQLLVYNDPRVAQGERWLIPYWKEPADVTRESPCTLNKKMVASATGGAGVLMSTADDHRLWKSKGNIRTPGTWLIEGTLATQANGHILHYFRTQKGLIYNSISKDGGSTWGTAKPTVLPNPNSKVDMINLDTGELALAFNDYMLIKEKATQRQLINKGRKRLRVAVSCNGGEKWANVAELEAGHFKYYFHYPTLLQDGKTLFIIYSTMLGGRFQQMEIGGGIKIAEVELP